MYIIDLKEHWHITLLHLPPSKLFNTESDSVNEACKNKTCIVLAH